MKHTVSEYAEKYGADPSKLVNEHYMSDEVSSLETDDDETKEDWDDRMVMFFGLTDEMTRRAGLKEVKFLERVIPNWRSSEVSVFLLSFLDII